MKFACQSCQTKYTIPDEKVRGRVLKIRCKKCDATITVKEEVQADPEPQAPPLEERTRVADVGMMEMLRAQQAAVASATAPAPQQAQHEWFAMIGGQQVGPLTPDDFAAKAQSGEINDKTFVWRDGLADWKRATEVEELAGMFQAEPPPAPAEPPPAPANLGDGLFGGEGDQTEAPELSPAPAAYRAPAAAAAPAGGGNLAGLLDDDGFGGNSSPDESTGAKPLPAAVSGAKDPFASVPDAPGVQQPAIGEQTRFFMKKAGVTNRNPWWKYAIFVGLVLAAPVAVVYALGSAGYGGTIVVLDKETGEAKEVNRFSVSNFASADGLKGLLTGESNAEAAEKVEEVKKKAGGGKKRTPKPGEDAAATTGGEDGFKGDREKLTDAERELLKQNAGLGADDGPKGIGAPKSGKDDPKPVAEGGSLDQAKVAKVIGDQMKAFNQCVEQQLKRNPSFKAGKVMLTITVKPSGTVTDPKLNKPDVDSSELGECIKKAAKRMVFPRFEGEEETVEAPLVLTSGG